MKGLLGEASSLGREGEAYLGVIALIVGKGVAFHLGPRFRQMTQLRIHSRNAIKRFVLLRRLDHRGRAVVALAACPSSYRGPAAR